MGDIIDVDFTDIKNPMGQIGQRFGWPAGGGKALKKFYGPMSRVDELIFIRSASCDTTYYIDDGLVLELLSYDPEKQVENFGIMAKLAPDTFTDLKVTLVFDAMETLSSKIAVGSLAGSAIPKLGSGLRGVDVLGVPAEGDTSDDARINRVSSYDPYPYYYQEKHFKGAAAIVGIGAVDANGIGAPNSQDVDVITDYAWKRTGASCQFAFDPNGIPHTLNPGIRLTRPST